MQKLILEENNYLKLSEYNLILDENSCDLEEDFPKNKYRRTIIKTLDNLSFKNFDAYDGKQDIDWDKSEWKEITKQEAYNFIFENFRFEQFEDEHNDFLFFIFNEFNTISVNNLYENDRNIWVNNPACLHWRVDPDEYSCLYYLIKNNYVTPEELEKYYEDCNISENNFINVRYIFDRSGAKCEDAKNIKELVECIFANYENLESSRLNELIPYQLMVDKADIIYQMNLKENNSPITVNSKFYDLEDDTYYSTNLYHYENNIRGANNDLKQLLKKAKKYPERDFSGEIKNAQNIKNQYKSMYRDFNARLRYYPQEQYINNLKTTLKNLKNNLSSEQTTLEYTKTQLLKAKNEGSPEVKDAIRELEYYKNQLNNVLHQITKSQLIIDNKDEIDLDFINNLSRDIDNLTSNIDDIQQQINRMTRRK